VLEYAISRATGHSLFGGFPSIRTQKDIERGRNLRRGLCMVFVVLATACTPARGVTAVFFADVAHALRSEL
jgi:hypothetical protein